MDKQAAQPQKMVTVEEWAPWAHGKIWELDRKVSILGWCAVIGCTSLIALVILVVATKG